MTVKWYECSSCLMMSSQNFDSGNIISTRKPFTKDELRGLFPTTGEGRVRKGGQVNV